MASGDARDLELRLVTRDEIDTDAAVRQVDNLGEATEEASRHLDDQADAAERAERAVDDLASSASSAASDVDQLGSAADDAGRQLGDGVEAGAERGTEAVDSFKDESAAAVMELASSFDGSLSGMLDAAQGAAPALGAAFGPVGLAIGSAVGVGIGFARAQAERLAETVSGLTDTLLADAGRISRDSVLAKVGELASSGDIDKLADQARDAGVDVGDFILALSGDAPALERSRRALEARRGELKLTADEERALTNANANSVASIDTSTASIDKAERALTGQGEALEAATSRYELYQDAQEEAAGQTEDSIAAQEALKAALDDAATGAADLAVAIGEGADAVEDALLRQLEAQSKFEENTEAVYANLGEAGVAFATAQGDNAAEAMALLAAAPVEQGARIVGAWTELGNNTGASIAQGIYGAAPAASAALLSVIEGLQYTADRARPINVRVRTDPSGLNELETIVRTGKVRQ